MRRSVCVGSRIGSPRLAALGKPTIHLFRAGVHHQDGRPITNMHTCPTASVLLLPPLCFAAPSQGLRTTPSNHTRPPLSPLFFLEFLTEGERGSARRYTETCRRAARWRTTRGRTRLCAAARRDAARLRRRRTRQAPLPPMLPRKLMTARRRRGRLSWRASCQVCCRRPLARLARAGDRARLLTRRPPTSRECVAALAHAHRSTPLRADATASADSSQARTPC